MSKRGEAIIEGALVLGTDELRIEAANQAIVDNGVTRHRVRNLTPEQLGMEPAHVLGIDDLPEAVVLGTDDLPEAVRAYGRKAVDRDSIDTISEAAEAAAKAVEEQAADIGEMVSKFRAEARELATAFREAAAAHAGRTAEFFANMKETAQVLQNQKRAFADLFVNKAKPPEGNQ